MCPCCPFNFIAVSAAIVLGVAMTSLGQLARDTPTPRDPVSALITELSSDDYQIRERATQDLIDRGDAVLPRLRQLLPLTVDGETRNRIQSAIDQISEHAVTGESLITLDVTDADPESVFAELSRQARARIVVAPDVLGSLPKVSFRCDQEPFWPVLRRLCSPLGLQPDAMNLAGALAAAPGRNFQPPSRTLRLVRSVGAWDRTPTTFSGPFMICIQQITQTGVIVPAVNQRGHTLLVQCVVLAEPKMTVIGRSPMARVTDPDPEQNPAVQIPGVGNLMNNRPPFSRGSYYNASAASAWSVMISLARPAEATDSLPRLRAVATARVLVRSEIWELPDISRAAPRFWTTGGRTFTIHSVTRKENNIEVLCSATRRTAGGAVDPEDQAVFNYLELLDPAGRTLNVRLRAQRPATEPGNLTYMINFETTAEGVPLQPATAPLRLRWRLPLESREVELPIAFDSLPLP